jgi:hypothetical protein
MPAPSPRVDHRLLALVCAALAVGAVLYSAWDSVDLAVYVEAGRRFAAGLSPYGFALPPIGALFRYSPVFAAGMAPLSGLPFPLVALGWRLVEVGLLALSVRGLGWLGVAIVLNPLVVLDLSVANVGTLFLAAMITVVRWPSARTVTAYAILVLLIPKPTLLPVLAWGLWRVRASWLPVAGVGVAGLAMAQLIPDFGHAILSGDRIFGMLQNLAFLPAWLVGLLMASSVALTVASVRRPRLLGPASVLASPYYFSYSLVPLLLGLVPGPEAERGAAAAPARPADPANPPRPASPAK